MVYGKKGLSHIEAILSFVLFMGFLIGAFFFLNPFTSNRTLDTTLGYTFNEIEDSTTLDVLIYSVSIDPLVLADQLVIDKDYIVSLPISDVPPGYNPRVENNDGIDTPSEFAGGVIVFDISPPFGFFANVMMSEEFPDSSPLGDSILLNSDQFTLSSFDEKTVYGENRFELLKDSYYADYKGLKSSFNLPGRVDFGFTVSFSDGTSILANQTIPPEFEVFSESKRIEIMRSSGKIEFADLIWKVW